MATLYPLNVVVTDDDSLEVMPDVNITVWNEDYTVCMGTGVTDVNGAFTLPLEDGTYFVFLQKDNVSFFSQPKEVGINGSTYSLNVEAHVYVNPTIGPGLVYLYGYINDLNMNPIPSSKVVVFLTKAPQNKNGFVLDKGTVEVFTDATGLWSLLVPGGCSISVTILSCNFSKSGTLPFSGRLDINYLR
jgi:hypothetical protein